MVFLPVLKRVSGEMEEGAGDGEAPGGMTEVVRVGIDIGSGLTSDCAEADVEDVVAEETEAGLGEVAVGAVAYDRVTTSEPLLPLPPRAAGGRGQDVVAVEEVEYGEASGAGVLTTGFT